MPFVGFRRAGIDSIDVDLPETVMRLVKYWADEVQRTADEPMSTGNVEMFGKINEDVEADDPMLTLERQMMIGGVCALVIGSSDKRRLTDAEAEAWLQVFGMALSLEAAKLKISSYEDLDILSEEDGFTLSLLQGLASALTDALDAAV